MKKIFLAIAIGFSGIANAQVTKISLQASGLTCSMCSNAINKALKKLDFIDQVEANLKDYTFELSFKNVNSVDFDKIRRKVEEAGFSVSGFVATIDFTNKKINDNQSVVINGQTLRFIERNVQLPAGTSEVKLHDKGFVSVDEFRRNQFTKEQGEANVYHVTL